MKSIGQQAKEFREHKGWTWVRMAAEVSKNSPEPVSRVVIKQLEDAGGRMPSYLRALAKTMGVSSDDLLDGRYAPPGAGDEKQPAAEEAAAETLVTPPQAIKALQQALQMIGPAARESAATLLSSLAREPAGRWADWLADLIQSETAKTDRAGIPSSNSSDLAPTMVQKGGPQFGPVLTRAFEAGKELDDLGTDRGISKPRGGTGA